VEVYARLPMPELREPLGAMLDKTRALDTRRQIVTLRRAFCVLVVCALVGAAIGAVVGRMAKSSYQRNK
jgi:hypothetical protein